jgi:hypothetical protein
LLYSILPLIRFICSSISFVVVVSFCARDDSSAIAIGLKEDASGLGIEECSKENSFFGAYCLIYERMVMFWNSASLLA